VLAESDYIAALLTDLDAELAHVAERPLSSIFFGGGTPSLFSAASISEILDGVRARIALAVDCEITLEANPGASEAERFAGYRAAGVNRLSIGVQSFADDKLKRLGRVHDSSEAHKAIKAARSAGFERFNLDLMYALPEQSLEQAEADLATAIAFEPEHISYYQLTLEPGTAFYRQPPVLPDDELAWAMQSGAEKQLQAAGYGRYEVSAWSKPDKQCRHNLNYWQFGDYLGIGAGAHGKVTLSDGRILRRSKRRSPAVWTAAARPQDLMDAQHELKPADRRFEVLLNGLRLEAGIDWSVLQQRAGLSRDDLQPELASLTEMGLLKADETGLRATAAGRPYLNTILERFLPES